MIARRIFLKTLAMFGLASVPAKAVADVGRNLAFQPGDKWLPMVQFNEAGDGRIKNLKELIDDHFGTATPMPPTPLPISRNLHTEIEFPVWVCKKDAVLIGNDFCCGKMSLCVICVKLVHVDELRLSTRFDILPETVRQRMNHWRIWDFENVEVKERFGKNFEKSVFYS